MTVQEIIQALRIQQVNGEVMEALDASPEVSYDEAEAIDDQMLGQLRTLGYSLRDMSGTGYRIWPRGE